MRLGFDAIPDIPPERADRGYGPVGRPSRTRAKMRFASKIPHGYSTNEDRRNSRIFRVVNEDIQR